MSSQIGKDLWLHICNRCEHEWTSKIENPGTCGNQKCRSPYWKKIPQKIKSQTNQILSSRMENGCTRLLDIPKIRFAGMVDKEGKLISGGFKEGLTPHEDETRLQSFFDFVSKVSIKKEFDESLGHLNYLAARRDKAVLVSFPFSVSQVLLLISADPTVNIENLAKKVVEIFSGVE